MMDWLITNILTSTVNPILLSDDLRPHVWRRTCGKFDFLVVAVKRRRVWLRHCTTSRKVTSSIAYGVIGIFHALNAGVPWQKWVPGMSPGGQGGRCLGLTTLPPSRADCPEILRASTSWSPKGLCRPVMWQEFFHVGTAVKLVQSHPQYQCFSTFVRPRPGKFFFHKTRARPRPQQIYS